MQRTGRFIVFEGGEGTGKSTQAGRLAEHLDALLTREPGGTALGDAVRSLFLSDALGEIEPRAELLLIAAARAQHVTELIGPTLRSGRDVVCDRFTGSTLAYQGYGRGLPLEDVLVSCELATHGLAPDLTVFLDLDDATAKSRRKLEADRIEAQGDAFHARVFAGFRELAAADPTGWVRVDASGSIDEVESAVREAVHGRLGAVGSKR